MLGLDAAFDEEHRDQPRSGQLGDLAAVLALPAMWKGRDPRYVVDSLLDVLSSLLRLDVARARLDPPPDGCPRLNAWRLEAPGHPEIASFLAKEWTSDETLVVASIANSRGGAPLRVAAVRQELLEADLRVVVGARRADFPTDAERFLLRGAVEQAAIAIEATAIARRERAQRMAAERARAAAEQARAEAEDARREIEATRAQLAAVLEQMPSGVIIAEAPSGRVILDNPRVEQISGRLFLAATVVGEYARYQGFHPDGRRYRPEEWPLARSITTGEVVTGEEIEIEREDGTRAWISASSGPVRDLQGNVVAGVVTFDDVTERKRAERAAAQLAAIVTSSADAIVSKTLDGIVTSWNTSAEHMFGYTAEEMIGQSIRRIIPFERSDEEDLILARLRAGERIEHFETVRVTKDGRRLDVSLTISPVRDRAGNVIGASKIARDITARRLIERERAELLATTQEAVRARDELLALVSHDLKNPLAAVKGHAQLLQRRLARGGLAENQRIGEGLANIDLATRKMQRLVDELLDHARVQAGEPLGLERRPTDLVALARRVAEEQQETSPSHQIRVESDVAELVGPWDPARLERVIENLLTNAIKYSPAGSDVAVKLAREEDASGSRAVLSVRDQGIGIPAADRQRIFERFFRARNVSGQVRGTGLGLAGAHQIVEQHGGAIEVASEEGQGSTFTVRLPLAATEG